MSHSEIPNTPLALNQIHNVDCMEGFRLISDKSVELILTDIPYSVINRPSNGLRSLTKRKADKRTFDLGEFLAECVRVCRGSIYVFCGTEQVSFIREFLVKSKLSTRLIVWEKTNPSPMNGQSIWLSGLELCVYGKSRGATFNEHCKNTILRFPSGKSKIHPTQKPLELFEYLVSVSTQPGNLVLDPCMGSGTTALACLRSGRNFIGFEQSKRYFQKSLHRIHAFEKQRNLRPSLRQTRRRV